MAVSELNRRLAWLKVTVCLVLPWLEQKHNIAHWQQDVILAPCQPEDLCQSHQ